MSITNRIPKIIGHRGAKGFTPENTLVSFSKAKELGTLWVEFDVQLTSDNIPIVIHDETLERTTNGKGIVTQAPWSLIKTLDAGSWFSPEFAGEKVPSFEETIIHLEKLNLGANVEIKVEEYNNENTAIAVAKMLAEKWPKTLPPPLVSSFHIPSLVAAKKINPELIIGVLFEEIPKNWKNIAKQVQATTINVDHQNITIELIQEISKEGYPILAYTVNNQTRANELFSLGIHSIFTDFPWK